MKLSISIVLIGLLFGGCGSSSGPSSDDVKTGTGYYKDSAVEGINYSCGSKSGTTDASGKFTFEEGKNCTFTLAGMTLRAVKASELFDKVEIVEDNATVYTLLQTLDSDANASNGITILPQVVEQLKKVQVTLPASPAEVVNVHNEIKNVQGYKGKLKTEDEAKEHVIQTQTEVTKRLLAGKTLYSAYNDNGTNKVAKLIFNSDVTSVHSQQIMGGSKSGNATLTIEGDTLISYEDDGVRRHKIVAVTDAYIEFEVPQDDGSIEIEKLYFKEADARASLGDGSDNSQNASTDLKALLAGKTVYEIDDLTDNKEINSGKFNSEFNSVVVTELGNSESETLNFTYNNGEMSFTDGQKLKFDSKTATYIKLIDEKGQEKIFYYLLEDAQNNLESSTGGGDNSQNASTDLKALLAGKTIYKPDNYDGSKSITPFTFNQDMTEIKAIASSGTFTFDITTSGDRFTFDHEGKKRIYKLTGHNSEYLSMDYLEDETERVKEQNRFYFDRSRAESYLNTL